MFPWSGLIVTSNPAHLNGPMTLMLSGKSWLLRAGMVLNWLNVSSSFELRVTKAAILFIGERGSIKTQIVPHRAPVLEKKISSSSGNGPKPEETTV